MQKSQDYCHNKYKEITMIPCQLCEVTEIPSKTFYKLDDLADGADLIICRDCYNGNLHNHVIQVKAESKSALLVRMTSLKDVAETEMDESIALSKQPLIDRE
jgi:hypothetical protein